MGLDQYIYKINARDIERFLKDGCYRVWHEEVACFRKVNALHKWVRETYDRNEYNDNCQMIPLQKKDVQKLALDLDKVLQARHKKNGKSIAKKLFPPTSGFFFGTTDLDDPYYRDVEDVANVVDTILADWTKEDAYCYYAWY